MNLQRAPSGPLRLFVTQLWFSDAPGRPGGAERERVLPTGAMHVVVRLNDHPLWVYPKVDNPAGQNVGTAVIGGARASFYVRDVSQSSCAVGAMLRPGAALPLFGVPAEELAGRHTPLEDVWGGEVSRLRERLVGLASPHDRLALFEAALAARLPQVRGVHPAVAHALERFDVTSDVGKIVGETGYSHRWFISVFRQAVGLSPKKYCRVLRLQRALHHFERDRAPRWSDVAFAAGFSNQAHLTRELQELGGVTPTELQRLAPRHTHHLPIRY